MPIILKQQHSQHGKKCIQQQSSIKSVLNSLKEQSQIHLSQEQKYDIDAIVRKKQATTYEVMLFSQKEYIQHQFSKLSHNVQKNEAIQGVQMITKRFLLNYELSSNNKYKINVKNLSVQGVNDFHERVKSKLTQINTNFDDLKIKNSHQFSKMSKSCSINEGKSLTFNGSTSINSSSMINKKRTQEYAKNILQFKQPSYWLKNQEKSQKIKEFLNHHRKEQISRQKKLKQSMEKYQQKIQQQQKQQVQAKKQAKLQIFRRGLQRTLQYKDRRENQSQNHEDQLQKIEEFLEKINPNNKRLYKILEQNYSEVEKKQLQEYRKKLNRIREEHLPFDKQQLEEHIQRYEEYKESLNDVIRGKKQELNEQLHEIGQELKNMFKSRHYDIVAEKQSMSPYKRSLSEMIERKSKKNKFAQNVKLNFQPKVSQRKRQQLEESIRLLELSEDKSKKKVFKNGSINFEDKEEIDRRKLGISYLTYLKKYLENKPKKENRPISSKTQKINYLRQNDSGLKLKSSVQEWKKIIDDESLNAKDKFTFLKESASALEHKALQKQIEARNLKKSSQELQKKQQFDKLYLQSIETKMAILNNLMLERR